MNVNPKLASMVHNAVSTTNEYVDSFDKLLASPRTTIEIPREAIEHIRAVMHLNSRLVQELFEQNRTFMDEVEKLKKLLETS